MSISIRLAKFGKKHAPAYKIVVANTRDKRNGKFLDIIGHYNPSENPVKFEYDKEKYIDWKNKGALITDAVSKLVEGNYEQKEHDPHKKLAKGREEAERAAKQAEETAKESAEPVVEETPAETTEEASEEVETKEEN